MARLAEQCLGLLQLICDLLLQDRRRIALLDAMTLARDIDTVEEAAAKARELGIE